MFESQCEHMSVSRDTFGAPQLRRVSGHFSGPQVWTVVFPLERFAPLPPHPELLCVDWLLLNCPGGFQLPSPPEHPGSLCLAESAVRCRLWNHVTGKNMGGPGGHQAKQNEWETQTKEESRFPLYMEAREERDNRKGEGRQLTADRRTG